MFSFIHFLTRFCPTLCLAMLCSCGHPASQQQNVSQQPPVNPQQISEPPKLDDPTSGWSEEVRRAWSLFTKDGHWRIAQPGDFKSPGTLGGSPYANRPWISWWGAFAVIVVDHTRTDQNRFGIILFVEPKDMWRLPEKKRKPLKPVWLYRNRDLSRTSLEQASGSCVVVERGEDGTRKVCEVDWSESAQKYVCR